MKFKDQLKFMRKNMKKNRLRVFMTILATTMACAFLIVLASVGFGIQKSITEEIKSQQIITEVSVQGKENDGSLEQIKKGNLEELEETDNVTAVVRRNYIDIPVEASLDDRKADVRPTITNMDAELKANLTLETGAVPKSENEVIVGYHFAQSLLTEDENEKYQKDLETADGPVEAPTGYEGELVGKEITMTILKEVDGKEETKSFTFKVAGVVGEPAKDWVTDQNIYIDEALKEEILSFASIDEEFISSDIPYNEVLVYASSLEHVAQVTDDLKDKGYMVYSITEELDSVNLFFNVFKAGLIFVGTIAIIISSIGIFNTMTMAVTERTQEIGIMKALGAQPGIIRRLFLMESAYIGIVGSIIGVVISYAISFAANMLLPIILNSTMGEEAVMDFTFSYIPLSLVLISAGISIGVAMISGLRPAVKATNINVLSALRREL
ncbi:ABC transporter permease [Metabacillus litoralis]|uniref:Macrolide ABC transporter permease n=1 Tax=Metabacillus litoralis TaxID=152268 RepID=A0A179T3M0_9BACI|nr:ABC transporter permease [Metabacillus litoralis]OAS88716.1 macrolide ABC transporter permease [Metabacillus litoralis]